jgi:hypothetical protein
MASLMGRKRGDGRTEYLVQVRLKGHPAQTATFDRRSDAKKWAQATEPAIREGRYFPNVEAHKKTLADAIDSYLANELLSLAGTERRQLNWWGERLGGFRPGRGQPIPYRTC